MLCIHRVQKTPVLSSHLSSRMVPARVSGKAGKNRPYFYGCMYGSKMARADPSRSTLQTLFDMFVANISANNEQLRGRQWN